MSEEKVTADPKLQKELDSLNKKVGDVEAESETNVEVAPETTTETEESASLVEKDGEIYLSVESDEEDPDSSSPDKGQLDTEDNQTSPDENAVDAQTDTNEPDTYKGKSIEELTDMLTNAQKKIGEQGSELGKLRDLTKDDENLTDSEIYDRLTASDIEKGLRVEKTKLNDLDPYDAEAVGKQHELISQLESDLINKKTQEAITDRFNQSDNEKFMQTQKETFVEQGVEVSDGDFNEVTEAAKSYSENGKLTERGYMKAMLDKYGVGFMSKHYSMMGEKKAREDIKNASGKVSNTVDVRGSGKGSKLIRLTDMDEASMRKAIDNLSIEELHRLKKHKVS